MLDKLIPASLLLCLGSTLAFAGSPPGGEDAGSSGHHDDRFRGVKLKLASGAAGSEGPVTVYVNGEGATLRGGFEDAASNRSSIVESWGWAELELPPFSGGAARWREMMRCVEDQFADFEVVITDARPTSPGYIMLMVGGSPTELGERPGVAGVAPFSGSVLPGSVGFAFSEVHGADMRGLCETVAHEIGHTLGLDHSTECSDTMSYLSCGEKAFRDDDLSCGEWQARTCGNGASTQNSHGQLAAALGLRERPRELPTSDPPGPSPTPPLPPPDRGEPAPSEPDPWTDDRHDDADEWVWAEEWDEESWGEDEGEWIWIDEWDEADSGGQVESVEWGGGRRGGWLEWAASFDESRCSSW